MIEVIRKFNSLSKGKDYHKGCKTNDFDKKQEQELIKSGFAKEVKVEKKVVKKGKK